MNFASSIFQFTALGYLYYFIYYSSKENAKDNYGIGKELVYTIVFGAGPMFPHLLDYAVR